MGGASSLAAVYTALPFSTGALGVLAGILRPGQPTKLAGQCLVHGGPGCFALCQRASPTGVIVVMASSAHGGPCLGREGGGVCQVVVAAYD